MTAQQTQISRHDLETRFTWHRLLPLIVWVQLDKRPDDGYHLGKPLSINTQQIPSQLSLLQPQVNEQDFSLFYSHK